MNKELKQASGVKSNKRRVHDAKLKINAGAFNGVNTVCVILPYVTAKFPVDLFRVGNFSLNSKYRAHCHNLLRILIRVCWMCVFLIFLRIPCCGFRWTLMTDLSNRWFSWIFVENRCLLCWSKFWIKLVSDQYTLLGKER